MNMDIRDMLNKVDTVTPTGEEVGSRVPGGERALAYLPSVPHQKPCCPLRRRQHQALVH